MTAPSQPRSPLFAHVEFDGILSCVHCGLCSDVCPTYRELGTEQDSPRGRLFLMRGLWQGDLALNQEVIAPLSRCLDCRACETACPSGVHYGELLEKTRGVIQENRPQNFLEKLLREIFLKRVLTSTALLQGFSVVLKLYITLKLPRLLTQTFIKNFLPKFLVASQYMLPQFSGKSFKLKYSPKGKLPPMGQKKTRYRVGFFTGCILDVSESETHEATLTLLRAAGCEVTVPKTQNCCGALHVHSGDRTTSKILAQENLLAFGGQDWDAIVTNSAGCSAQLKEYHHLFSKNESPKGCQTFEEKVIDILEFLSKIPDFVEALSWREEEETILYDAPCHLKHAQGVDANPRDLLNRLPGVSLVALTESDWCCGSAGIYNLLKPELAGAILERKLDSMEETMKQAPKAHTIVTGNPGCLFQIRSGILRRNLPLRIVHPAVYMAERLWEN